MLEDLSRKRPEWETKIINHPELGLFWCSKMESYVLKYKDFMYMADFIELQYLSSMIPFSDVKTTIALWAMDNKLVPFFKID